MSFKTSLSFLLCLLSPATLPAAAADLKDCIGLALSNSASVKAYEQKLAGALALNESDRRGQLPKLTGSAQEGYSTFSGSSGLSDGMTGSAALELSLDLPKLLGGYPRLSRLEADKAAILLAIAKKEAARDVTAEYYRLYVLTAKRADYTAAGGYFDAQINDVEHLGKQGLDVKLDLLRSDLKRRSLAAEAVALDAEIAGSLMTLNSAAGAGFKTDDFAFTDIPQPASGAVSGATVSSALETRLDELEAGSAGEAYRQSAYAAAPSFTLGVSRSLRPIDPATELYRTYAAVNLDIFGFGQREAERRSLLGEWEYQKGLAADNRRKLELEKSRLSSEMDNAALACLAARANLFAAEKSLETSKEYYRQGKLKETDLLDIFSDYFSIKELALDSLGQYLDRLAGLGYYKD